MQLEYENSEPIYIALPLTILYVTILISATVGNTITSIVILRNKNLHTVVHLYLLSLSVSDVLLLIFGLPQEIIYLWRKYPYMFSESFCIFHVIVAETCSNASILTITALSVERYIAVCHPLMARTISNKSRIVKLLIAIWTVSLILALPMALQFGLFDKDSDMSRCTLVRILIPDLISITIKNSVEIKNKRILKTKLPTGNRNNSSQSKGPEEKSFSLKNVRMPVAVVLTFFICCLPYHIQRLVASDTSGSKFIENIYEIVTSAAIIPYYSFATINPILYYTMSSNLRNAFKVESIIEFEPGLETFNDHLLEMKSAQARVYIMYAGKNDAEVIFRDARVLQMTGEGYV
ncbi:hypothetical protein PGB90_001949 [Kerria lacca]